MRDVDLDSITSEDLFEKLVDEHLELLPVHGQEAATHYKLLEYLLSYYQGRTIPAKSLLALICGLSLRGNTVKSPRTP